MSDRVIGWTLFLLVVGGFIFMIRGFVLHEKEREDQCAAAHGTYLPHEGVCVEMRKIPLN